MAQFECFAEGIEVNGQTIWSVIRGAGVFQNTARKFLAENGLPDVKDSGDAWYPQQAWLDTFRALKEAVGPKTLFLIGKKIPESAEFPPEIQTIQAALGSIDVAFHMNHRRDGKVLFDPATGTMGEGIGHYQVVEMNDRSATLRGHNSYPCAFDRGIVTAMAERFATAPTVEHDDGAPCREKGDDSCTYHVRW